MTYYFGDSVWSQRILLNFCLVSISFYILIINFSWTVAQTPINHSIFWKSIMTTFRCRYANCFNWLRFLAAVSTKLWKMSFLANLKTITQHRNMETRQTTPFFKSTSYAVCNIQSYHFRQPIIFFLKVDTLRLLKIHIMFCPPSGAKKRYQLMHWYAYCSIKATRQWNLVS